MPLTLKEKTAKQLTANLNTYVRAMKGNMAEPSYVKDASNIANEVLGARNISEYGSLASLAKSVLQTANDTAASRKGLAPNQRPGEVVDAQGNVIKNVYQQTSEAGKVSPAKVYKDEQAALRNAEIDTANAKIAQGRTKFAGAAPVSVSTKTETIAPKTPAPQKSYEDLRKMGYSDYAISQKFPGVKKTEKLSATLNPTPAGGTSSPGVTGVPKFNNAQELADFARKTGATNLQDLPWWKNSPFKQQAWGIIQAGHQIDTKASIDEEANKVQQAEVAIIEKETNKVDLSSSATLMEELIQTLEGGPEPTESLSEIQESERAKLGVGDLESALAQVDSDIAKLDADMSSLMPEEDNRRVAVAGIRRRQSAEQVQYDRQRRDLLAERSSVAAELNMKYGVIDSMVKLAGMDIDNARQEYQDKLDRSMKLLQLLKGQEAEEAENEEKQVDTARANLQIITNLLKEGDLQYSELDDSQLADIRAMEITAGLPAGFTAFVHEKVKDPVTSFLTGYVDSSGNRIQPVVTKKADGTFSIQNINLGPVRASGGGGGAGGGGPYETADPVGAGPKGDANDALDVSPGAVGGQCGRYVNNYTGIGMGDTYASKMKLMDESITTPAPGMIFVMKYKSTGHTGFIMSIDANGIATVKDSNWGLDEKVRIHKIPVSQMTGFRATPASVGNWSYGNPVLAEIGNSILDLLPEGALYDPDSASKADWWEEKDEKEEEKETELMF